MESDRDRFALLSVLGSGSRTTTEQSAVRTAGSGVRVITVVRLRPDSEADGRTRDTFVTKARVLMALSEPTIAATLEFGYSRGSHYVAREFIDGLTLRQILKTARDNRMQLPAAFACHVVLQQCASLLALRRMLRTIAPELAHACFAATIRSIVVGRDGHARWVDPLGLDDPSLPSTTSADPTGEEVSALVGLLYELCTGCTPPRPNEVSEFAL